jgi:hypothetical protein
MRTRTLLIGFALTALPSTHSFAQIQRLIIPDANIQISPGSSAIISTCRSGYVWKTSICTTSVQGSTLALQLNSF